MMEKSTGPTSLTKFKDCLRVPPTLRPQIKADQQYILRVHMRPARVQLHSELPPSQVWTYEGSLPGPTIEVSRGQRLQVEWINAIPEDQPYPITAVTAPDGSQNEPGRSGRPANSRVSTLPPWTVVHLHGARTIANSDGWTENGTIWPYLPVEARQYRLRLLNGSNSRFYRLVLLDEQGKVTLDKITQIGTDGGLLGRPVAVPRDGLILAPAERADLIVDFRALRGQRLTLVNTAGAPFDNSPATQPPGMPDLDNRLPHPEVMEFRVSPQPVDDPFVMPATLSTSYRRLEHDRLPPDHQHRLVALVEYPDGMLTLRELAEVLEGDAASGEALIVIADERGKTVQYRTVAKQFEDTVNWFVAYGSTEVWSIINLTEDTHPFHVHLVQFQALSRDLYNKEGFNPETGGTTAPVFFQKHGTLDENEMGWKDTVRVNPGELVSIAATFDGFTGRFMYHCHLLEHEDHDMMRPFIVMPAAALAAMDMPGMSIPMPTDGEHK